MDDAEKLLIWRTTDELGLEREQEGNLRSDLVLVDAIEDTVQLSIIESCIEAVDELSFRRSNCFARDEGSLGVVAGAREVVGKLIGGIKEGAGEGGANRTETRRFEGAAVGSDSGIEVVGAEIDLFSEVAGFGTHVTEGDTKNKDCDEADNAADGDFDDERKIAFRGWLSRGDGAVRLGDLLKIFKVIHKHIIT